MARSSRASIGPIGMTRLRPEANEAAASSAGGGLPGEGTGEGAAG